MGVFEKQGVFRHKKVAVFGGDAGDEAEMAVVQSALTKLHVPVVATAVDSAPQGDLPAENAEVTTIAERFRSDGVDEVVAVGDGSPIWPEGLSADQSTYNPPYVATSEGDFSGAVGGDYSPNYLSDVVTSSAAHPAHRHLGQRRDPTVRAHSSGRHIPPTGSGRTTPACPSPKPPG